MALFKTEMLIFEKKVEGVVGELLERRRFFKENFLKKNGKRGLFEKSPLHPKNFCKPKSPISAREGEETAPLSKNPKPTSARVCRGFLKKAPA
ncbi:MAG: hypothetical protein IJD10_00965, partial [Clostridia bacterium]|nr:hypothetical protein [Clostridia bacterium]